MNNVEFEVVKGYYSCKRCGEKMWTFLVTSCDGRQILRMEPIACPSCDSREVYLKNLRETWRILYKVYRDC